MKKFTNASSEWSGEAAHMRSQIVYTSYVIKVFSHIRAANDQASLHIRTVSPEPLESH